MLGESLHVGSFRLPRRAGVVLISELERPLQGLCLGVDEHK